MKLLTIGQIQKLISDGNYELTLHALHRIVERNISGLEIREAGRVAELIEDYPTDKYGATCLLLGWTRNNRPLHLHVSKTEDVKVKIITLYEPAITEWENFRKRITP